METQERMILKHLESGRPVTQIQAAALFDCWRLSARIFNLRKRGYPVKTTLMPTKDGKSHYAKYWMGEGLI